MAKPHTLAFSSHRLETLPLAEDRMATHDHIVIEEPSTPDVSRMLCGEMAVEDYLLAADYEYPAFAAAACRMLRRLHQAGKQIHPCEPFMARLIRIHDHFTAGGRPAALAADHDLWPVYAAEREATGRLLAFYRASAAGDFDHMVRAAGDFAEADAARFRLRDRLRSQAIAELMAAYRGRFYVEAGYLHLRLLRELRGLRPAAAAFRPVYLLGQVYRAGGHRSHLYGPGDLLTLALIFGRSMGPDRRQLLAARSLVYNQLALKEEMRPGRDAYPDANDDRAVIQYVNQLSYEDCRRCYGRIAGMSPAAARRSLGGFSPPDGLSVPDCGAPSRHG